MTLLREIDRSKAEFNGAADRQMQAERRSTGAGLAVAEGF
jgi:hypothetical protein